MAAGADKDELPNVTEQTLGGDRGSKSGGLDFVMDVPLRLSVEIGSTHLLVREVLQLVKGSVVELDRLNGEPADVYVNERLVAHGEVTVVEDRLAVKIFEVVTAENLTGRAR